MSHDKNGTPLKEGDKVLVEFDVKEVSANADFCNCKCETTLPMLPGTQPVTIWFNTKQVLLLQKAIEPEQEVAAE